jgi:hypothetical protein
MSTSKDWLPNDCEGQLSMAKDWLPVMTANAVPWNIPAAAITEFTALTNAAEAALAEAKNEATRTPVATALCREAFKALNDRERDTKRRYFLSPPLTEADFAALGLARHTPGGGGKPTSQVTVETFLAGRHELGVRVVYVTGSPTDPANKGYRIWYSVIAPGGTR